MQLGIHSLAKIATDMVEFGNVKDNLLKLAT